METLEELQAILDEAPEGATHSNNVGEYGCYSIGGYFLRWTPNSVESTANCNWRSLADIQRIVYLMRSNLETKENTINEVINKRVAITETGMKCWIRVSDVELMKGDL